MDINNPVKLFISYRSQWNRITSWILYFLLPGIIIFSISCSPAKKPPQAHEGIVAFTHYSSTADQVFIAGTFNDWNQSGIPMTEVDEGVWQAEMPLAVGFHEYKFVVDGNWIADKNNPATVINNYGEKNSVIYMNSLGEVELRGPEKGNNGLVEKSDNRGFINLAIIWHQHQPFYLDASKDQLIAPWVRTHTTKDYYDMTSMLLDYPDIHVTVNLTPVLLYQLEEYYVNRLMPFYDKSSNRIKTGEFLRKWKGKTDPWVDLMFIDTGDFTQEDDDYLFRNQWSCFSISRVVMNRFPQYVALSEKPTEDFTVQDKLNLKCFFWLANFDPRFLRGKVKLVTGKSVDLSDLLDESDGPVWTLEQDFNEDDANRLVAEFAKIAEAVIPLHKSMRYDPARRKNQVEMITTPYYHPILPLISNLHSGKSESDQAPDSIQYSYHSDAEIHVQKAVEAYEEWFGGKPDGMWPAEGSVSQGVLDIFSSEGVKWIATGDGVLSKSTPEGQVADSPYRILPGDGREEIVAFFRDTHLSDLIGFRYQRWDPETAAEDLLRQIMAKAPVNEGESNLVTILLDGENAWEWYEQDPDAIKFLELFYQKLEQVQDEGKLITVTPMEYLTGNPKREIEPHPVATLPEITKLWPGSWIRADYSTWVGEDEENRAWKWLETVREDLQTIAGSPSDKNMSAWQSMLAAEGSDWFWWYGDDQNTGEGDQRWDKLYRKHLKQVYIELENAGYTVDADKFSIPSLMDEISSGKDGQGAMSKGE